MRGHRFGDFGCKETDSIFEADSIFFAERGDGVRKAIQKVRQTLRRFRRIPIRERLWLSRNKFKPASYALYQFAGKDARERANYISDGQADLLHGVNTKAPAEFLRNKLVFHRLLEKTAVRVRYPTLRGVVRRQRLTAAAPPYRVTSLDAILKDTEAVVVKPIGGFRGRGVQFVTSKGAGIDHDMGQLIPAAEKPGYDEMIIVDRIEQSHYSAEISPVSSNTVRVVCMRRPLTRELFIPIAVHRFGTQRTAPLDNFSKGGLSCAIDLETGRLGPGVMHPSKTNWSLQFAKCHPDTGVRIDGTMIPNWPRLLDDVAELMSIFPDLEFVGWDMLPVEDGWCVIEGNPLMDVDLLQVHGGLLADDRVREFFEYHCS